MPVVSDCSPLGVDVKVVSAPAGSGAGSFWSRPAPSKLVAMHRTLPVALRRIAALGAAAGLAAGLAACDSAPGGEDEETQAASPEEQAQEVADNDQGLPADARPEPPEGASAWNPCPYLDEEWVSDTNGQRTLAVDIDERFDVPACVFWSYDEGPHLQVLVRHMANEFAAEDVVNTFAPVDFTTLAEEPSGWDGGRGNAETIPDFDGAVYAVQKDNVAVVVLTNQMQSVKAESVAVEAINNLGL